MQRPTSVTVFGVLNILFGVLGLLGTAVNVLMMFVNVDAASVQANPILRIQQQQPFFAAMLKINVVLGFVASIALIIAGIGLLNMRSWARKVSIGYVIYSVVSVILFMALVAWFLVPMFQDFDTKARSAEQAGIGLRFRAVGAGVKAERRNSLLGKRGVVRTVAAA